MKNIWTSEATGSFNSNVDFLLQEWGAQVASDFMDRVKDVVTKIQSNPKLYTPIAHEVHRCVVVRQIVCTIE